MRNKPSPKHYKATKINMGPSFCVVALALGFFTIRARVAADDSAFLLPHVPVAVGPVGLWKWSTQGRNRQPEKTVLKIGLVTDRKVTGTLTDRGGQHSITKVSFS